MAALERPDTGAVKDAPGRIVLYWITEIVEQHPEGHKLEPILDFIGSFRFQWRGTLMVRTSLEYTAERSKRENHERCEQA